MISVFLILFSFFSFCSLTALPHYWSHYYAGCEKGLYQGGEWVSVHPDYYFSYFGLQGKWLRSLQLFSLDEYRYNKPLVFFIIHGTWAYDSPDFFSDEFEVFQGIKTFVEELSCDLQSPVELVSFRWSGKDCFEERQMAGEALSAIYNTHYGSVNGYYHTYVWGHSHGCNVANIASHRVVEPFNTLFYFASPVVQEESEPYYRPHHFHTLYNIYSTSDPVQFAGSVDRRFSQRAYRFGSLTRAYEKQPHKKVYNIRCQLEGSSPGHVTIKFIARHLFQLRKKIESLYEFHSHFDVNFFDENKYKRPDKHFLFYLREPLVVIREPLTVSQLIDECIASKQLSSKVIQVHHEVQASNKDEKLYKKLYEGKDIHQVSSFLQYIVDIIKDSYALIKSLTAALHTTDV